MKRAAVFGLLAAVLTGCATTETYTRRWNEVHAFRTVEGGTMYVARPMVTRDDGRGWLVDDRDGILSVHTERAK